MMASSINGSCGVHGSSTRLVVLNDINETITINAEESAAARDDPSNESDDGFGSASLVDKLSPGSETPDGNQPGYDEDTEDDGALARGLMEAFPRRNSLRCCWCGRIISILRHAWTLCGLRVHPGECALSHVWWCRRCWPKDRHCRAYMGPSFFAWTWLATASSANRSCGVHGSSTPLAVLNVADHAVTINVEDCASDVSSYRVRDKVESV